MPLSLASWNSAEATAARAVPSSRSLNGMRYAVSPIRRERSRPTNSVGRRTPSAAARSGPGRVRRRARAGRCGRGQRPRRQGTAVCWTRRCGVVGWPRAECAAARPPRGAVGRMSYDSFRHSPAARAGSGHYGSAGPEERPPQSKRNRRRGHCRKRPRDCPFASRVRVSRAAGRRTPLPSRRRG